MFLGAMKSDEEKQSVIHLAKKLNQKNRDISDDREPGCV